jgi:hypothetical protein
MNGTSAPGDALPELRVAITPTTVVLGAIASRDWRPMHHDYKFATERNGVADIFLNTPNQAAWVERYVTDWTGPRGRIGRLRFRMHDSIFPGDTMIMSGTIRDIEVDETGCQWALIDLTITADSPERPSRRATSCVVAVAIPKNETDNPWSRSGSDWNPARDLDAK